MSRIGTEDNRSYGSYEKRGNKRAEHFDGSGRKHLPFSWLQFDETKQEMFCTACREFPSLTNKNSSFSSGSPSFHTGNKIVNVFKATMQFQLLFNLS